MPKNKEIEEITPGQVLNLSDEEESKLVNTICDCINDVIQSRKTLSDNMITWKKNYEMINEEKTFPWVDCSNLKEPITEVTTDAVWSRLDRNVLAYEPLFLISPYDTDEDEIEWSAAKYEHYMQWDLKNNIKGFKTLSDWLFEGTLNGTGIIKVGWIKKLFKLQTRSKTINIIKNCPQLWLISLIDFLFPNHITNLDESWNAQRLWLSQNDLKIRQQKFGYKIPDKLGEMASLEDKNDYEQQLYEAMGIKEVRITSSYNPYKPNNILFEWWGDWYVNGRFIPIVATIFWKERQLARLIVNPKLNLTKPFVALSCWTRSNTILGRGMGQKMMNLQDEIDTLHRQRIDRVTLKLRPPIKYRTGSLSPDEQEFYPGKFFEMQDFNDMQEWQGGDVPQSAYQEEILLQGFGEKSSGVSDYTLGRESSILQSRATATGTLATIQEGDKKFDKMVQNIGLPFTELAQKLDIEYKEHLTEVIPLTKLKDILKPDDIYNRFQFEFKPSKLTINREVRQQRDLQMFSLLSQNPLITQNIEVLRKMTVELLLSFEKVDIADEIKKSQYIDKMEKITELTQALQYIQGLQGLMQMQNLQSQQTQGGLPPNAGQIR